MGKQNGVPAADAVRKRNKQLKEQLNAEKDARDRHNAMVRNEFDRWEKELQNERARYAKLQVQYDDLLLKYEEEIQGVRERRESVSE